MLLKATLLLFFVLSLSNTLKVIPHHEQTHEVSEEKKTLTVKFRKSDVQDVNSCKPNDDQCEVEICPDTNVMKASYSCYSVIREEFNAWMKRAQKKNKGSNFKIELSCWKVDEETDGSGDNGLSARPEGGFKNELFLCDINGQKPLHYHFA